MRDMGVTESVATGLAVSLLGLCVAAARPTLPHAIAARLPFLPVAAVFVLHLVVTAQALASSPWPPAAVLAAHLALFAAAVWFWLPVVGAVPRLGAARRTVYLFLAGPLLDLPALLQISAGSPSAGIAMIVAMLPIPLAAVASFALWMRAEERARLSVELPKGSDRVSTP